MAPGDMRSGCGSICGIWLQCVTGLTGVSLIVLRARNLHRVNLRARTSSCTMASSTSHTKLSLCSFLQSSSAKTLRNLRGEHLEFRQSHNMDAEKRAQRTWERRKEAWSQALIAGETGQTWLLPQVVDGRWSLACWCCRAAGVDSTWSEGVVTNNFGNLKRHHESQIHTSAMIQLGLLEPNEDTILKGAPSEEAFMKVLANRLECRSLQKGIPGVGQRQKVTDMQVCMSSSLCMLDKLFLQEAVSVSLFQDVRKHVLLVRFQACSQDLTVRSGVLAYEDL